MGLLSHQVRQAPPNATAVYVRHRPESTLLYQIVQEYWPEFQAELASHGKFLPAHVTQYWLQTVSIHWVHPWGVNAMRRYTPKI